MDDFGCALFVLIGIGGELDGPEALFWLELLLLWLAGEAMLLSVVVALR